MEILNFSMFENASNKKEVEIKEEDKSTRIPKPDDNVDDNDSDCKKNNKKNKVDCKTSENILSFSDFKLLEDGDGGGTAGATMGNTGGMGAVTAPQPSSIPGDVAGSKAGSGDLPSYNTSKSHFGSSDEWFDKKKKKKKTTSTKENRFNGTSDYSTMYISNFSDWNLKNDYTN